MRKAIFTKTVAMAAFMSMAAACSASAETKGGQGELTHRIEMAKDRLASESRVPAFTEDFILGDVNIDLQNPRRFYNYSGDLSGRYIEAMALCNKGEKDEKLAALVEKVIKAQQPDGRFGDPSLNFTTAEIEKTNHMPLLWGNGRMLMGLIAYYKMTGDPKALEAAKKGGDFFVKTYAQVTPEVVARLGQMADGVICFTTYVEPLAALAQLTGDKKYSDAAEAIYPTLPARGHLHTHGYLTTLKGVLDLYAYTKDKRHLDYVTALYEELVNSPDYTAFGSVTEYFGGGFGGRDEGCSSADFVNLSLALHDLTGDIKYLERAENAVYNSLFFNQFFTGDFGHHKVVGDILAGDAYNMSWWCCTMAGLKSMMNVRDHMIQNGEDIKLNLYMEACYDDGEAALEVSQKKPEGLWHAYVLNLRKMPDKKLLLRMPKWTEAMEVFVNGKKAETAREGDYLEIAQKIGAGDSLEARLKYALKIKTGDGAVISPAEIDTPISGILRCGPHMMAVDNAADFEFLAEPADNFVYAGTIEAADRDEILGQSSGETPSKAPYLAARYKHGGFPSYAQTVFRPVSEMTYFRHPSMRITHMFAPANASASNLNASGSLTAPITGD